MRPSPRPLTAPPTPEASNSAGSPVDPRIVTSSLWVAMLLVFAYVDIFGFFRADIIRGALASELPTVGFTIDQTFLTLTTVYVLIPILMVPLSLVLTGRANRITQSVIAGFYAASILVGMIGETWVYYLLGSSVEVALLGIIGWRAGWPRGRARRRVSTVEA